jgi:transcriptional regulator with XRE-family HTH domain
VLRLKFERDRRRLSQTRVAVAANIWQPTYSAIETGRLRPTAAQLQRLADIFNISPPEDLLVDVVVIREEQVS